MKKRDNLLVSDSTRAFLKEGQRIRKSYSLFDFLHGYIYARWPYHYIGIGLGEHPWAKKYGPLVRSIFSVWGKVKSRLGIPAKQTDHEHPTRTIADTYHGKVVPLAAARQLVTVNEAVTLPNLEHIIPYPIARDIVLRNPDHIVALECPCRSTREHPCLPLDVCLIVGEPFASLVVEHHPEKSRRISQQEAVEILMAEDARGHVHHAFFKDAMLNRFYAICNCCACCCGAMQSQRNGSPMLISSGYVASVDEVICQGCGDCEHICQFGAISVQTGTSCVDLAVCMGCGVCVEHCTSGALSLVRDPSKGEPLENFELISQGIK
jgi:ferredoxin